MVRVFHDMSGSPADGVLIHAQPWIGDELTRYYERGVEVVTRTPAMVPADNGLFAAQNESRGVIVEFNEADADLQKRIRVAHELGKSVLVMVARHQRAYELLDQFPRPELAHDNRYVRSYHISDGPEDKQAIAVCTTDEFFARLRIDIWLEGIYGVRTMADERKELEPHPGDPGEKAG